MKAIVLAILEDGSAQLLSGPEEKPSKQRNLINGFRSEGLPEGAVRVEMWERNCVKAASLPSAPVEPRPAKVRKPKAGIPAKEQSKKAKKGAQASESTESSE